MFTEKDADSNKIKSLCFYENSMMWFYHLATSNGNRLCIMFSYGVKSDQEYFRKMLFNIYFNTSSPIQDCHTLLSCVYWGVGVSLLYIHANGCSAVPGA